MFNIKILVAAVALLPLAACQLFPLTSIRSITGGDDSMMYGAVKPLMRMTPVDYNNDVSEMAPEMANPRHISNQCAKSTGDKANNRGMSDMVWAWGQFVDHDIDLTDGMPDCGTANIPIPKFGDYGYDESDLFNICDSIPVTRSQSTDCSNTNSPREQVNMISGFHDASNVYGSDVSRANDLREQENGYGLMKMSADGLLPKNTFGHDNAGGNGADQFFAGDIRANEQAGLTAMHTLFVREHNRLAGLILEEIKAENVTVVPELPLDGSPEANALGEHIYQLARKLVSATMQKITYEEFLPALMAGGAPETVGVVYDSGVSTDVANEFSTAAYRFGHSMLSSTFKRVDHTGTHASVPLRDIFFNSDYIGGDAMNVDRLLIGFTTQQANEIDMEVVDDVQSFLFAAPSAGACLDLAALNIQRSRDHGLPACNAMRAALDMDPFTDFDQITTNADVQERLRTAYNDNVTQVDAWVCGLAQDHVHGSLGELNSYIIGDQFSRLMRGDPFFYKWEPDLTDESNRAKLAESGIWDINKVRLAKVIGDNTVSNMSPQRSVMFRGGGGSGGDPHFKTYGGDYFEFQGACDLVLADVPSFADSKGLAIHLRTTSRYDYSYIESAAIKIGKEILEVSSFGQYILDGISNAEMPATLSGFNVVYSHPMEDQHIFTIVLDANAEIVVKVYKDLVNVDLQLSGDEKAQFGDTAGLMGSWVNGTHFARDGDSVMDDASEFGQEWQVLDTEAKLFMTDRAPQYPNKCVMPKLASQQRRLGESISSEDAEAACNHIKADHPHANCVHDVIATGDVSVAQGGTYYF